MKFSTMFIFFFYHPYFLFQFSHSSRTLVDSVSELKNPNIVHVGDSISKFLVPKHARKESFFLFCLLVLYSSFGISTNVLYDSCQSSNSITRTGTISTFSDMKMLSISAIFLRPLFWPSPTQTHTWYIVYCVCVYKYI